MTILCILVRYLSTTNGIMEDSIPSSVINKLNFFFVSLRTIFVSKISDWDVIKMKKNSNDHLSSHHEEKRPTNINEKIDSKKQKHVHPCEWISILIAVKWFPVKWRYKQKQHPQIIINHSIKWWHHRKSSSHWSRFICCMKWPNFWNVH